VDVDLPKKICILLSKLGLSKLNDDILYGKQKQDRDFLLKFQAEYEFWEDAAVFLERLRREDISKKHLFSYRRLGHMCQTLLTTETKAGREAIMRQLTQLQGGSGDDDQSERQSTHSNHSTARDPEDRSLTRDPSLRRLSTGNDETDAPSSPRGTAPMSSPSSRRLQSGGNAPLVKPVSLTKHRSKKSNGDIGSSWTNSSSLSLSCSDSGSSSCSGVTGAASSGRWDLKAAPPPKPKLGGTPKPLPPARKIDEAPKGGKATLLATLSADLDD
jgi:hypothetical protein